VSYIGFSITILIIAIYGSSSNVKMWLRGMLLGIGLGLLPSIVLFIFGLGCKGESCLGLLYIPYFALISIIIGGVCGILVGWIIGKIKSKQ